MNEKKILVTYFTASEGRVTERVAKNLAAAVSGDIFEIAAKDRYTKADINWINPLSRCNKEKLGKKDVEIAGKLQNIQDYDLILIGFPVWYGGAPNIINTFLKGYDFSGKKIALFATSGGGGMGRSKEKLQSLLPNARIIGAKLFKIKAGSGEMRAWVEEMQ